MVSSAQPLAGTGTLIPGQRSERLEHNFDIAFGRICQFVLQFLLFHTHNIFVLYQQTDVVFLFKVIM